MGFQPSHDIYELVFEEYPGLEIMAKGTSLGKLLDIGSINVNLNEKDQEKTTRVFKFISKRIITWNIEHPALDEDDFDEEIEINEDTVCPRCGLLPGMPLPTTVKGLMCLDMRFVMQIFFGWMQAVARLPLPKGLSTNDGATPDLNTMIKMLGEQQSPMASLERNLS